MKLITPFSLQNAKQKQMIRQIQPQAMQEKTAFFKGNHFQDEE
jgi:hypothetical protein